MNKWRTVRYTDDGCSLYQCLNCKNQWESRSIPGYITADYTEDYRTIEGTFRYIPKQHYCAYCGIKFDGVVGYQHPSNEKCLGKRRFEISHKRKDNNYEIRVFSIEYDYRSYGYSHYEIRHSAKECYELLQKLKKDGHTDIKVERTSHRIYNYY